MTFVKDVFGRDLFKDFDKVFVGFDDQFNKLSKIHTDLTKSIPNYPPYDIIKTGDNTYKIQLAVAGFSKQDVELELVGDKLIVRGNTSSDDKDSAESFLFKGISNRAFTRTFALDDQIEVKGAEMFNGMLQVFLERIIPEHKKPQKIEVTEKGETKAKKSKPQVLSEKQKDEITETL
jgi:molecular chaperone IbpA